MTEAVATDTRTRLLNAAADHIAAAPGEDVSMRAVCAAAGVKMPTLYHFFGSKQGLFDAVVARGFDLYMAQKSSQESSGDPIQDLRDGWNVHVEFGLANPGFYSLMYGTVKPGVTLDAQRAPSAALRALTQAAADQGRLVVGPHQAAAHVLATNIGVTLRQIILATPDPELTANVREGVIAAITGTGAPDREHLDRRAELHTALEFAAANPEILGTAETQLLTQWLHTLATASTTRGV